MTDPDRLDEIKRAAAVLLGPGQITEVRTFDPRATKSGFFDDVDTLADAVAELDADPNVSGVYWTINPVRPDMLDNRRDGTPRTPNTIGTAETGESAGNADIIGRRWLYIDLDPDRETGTAATDAEKGAAVERATAIADHLAAQGWPSPVVVDSGNGRHLYYRVDLPTDSPFIRACLQALKARFSDDAVKVDLAVSNAGRIARIPGTANRKGPNTTERPHRPTALIAVPDELAIVPVEMLQALADEIPRAPRPTTGTTRTATAATATETGDGFALVEWIAKHADRLKELGFSIETGPNPEYRFIARIRPCPFSPDHDDDGGSFIGQTMDGGLFARCHHDRCGGAGDDAPNRWAEFRQMVEPTGTITNRDGLALDVIRRRRKVARLAELDDLLSTVDENDELADDLRTVGTLVWLNFDDDAIADIMQRCRPSTVDRRPDYLRKTIDKARADAGPIYDPGRYVYRDRAAEIVKATPPAIVELVRIGGVRYVMAGPIDAETDTADYLRSIALYLVDRKKASGEIAAILARKNERLPDGQRLDADKLAAVGADAERDYIAARRRALAAAVVPDRDQDQDEKTPPPSPYSDPSITPDAIAIAYQILAGNAVDENGAPVTAIDFMLNTFARDHVGDRDVARCLIYSETSKTVENSNGVHVTITGESGSGKSHAAITLLKQIPARCKLDSFLSDKSLFYHDDMLPGTTIIVDDKELSDMLQDVIKNATTHFTESVEIRTIGTDRKPLVMQMPERCVWWLIRAQGIGDDQVQNRCIQVWADDSFEQTKKVLKRSQKTVGAPPGLALDRTDLIICRAMWDIVKRERAYVEIPFNEKIVFQTTPTSRRDIDIFWDLIMSHALLNIMQRATYRTPEGLLVVVAEWTDFDAARNLFQTLSKGEVGSQLDKMTRTEKQIVAELEKMPGDPVTFKSGDIQRITGLSQTRVSRALKGETTPTRGATSSGLLVKCPALEMTRKTITETTDRGPGKDTKKTSVHVEVYSFDKERYRAWNTGVSIDLPNYQDKPDRICVYADDMRTICGDVRISEGAQIAPNMRIEDCIIKINFKNLRYADIEGNVIGPLTDPPQTDDQIEKRGGVDTHTHRSPDNRISDHENAGANPDSETDDAASPDDMRQRPHIRRIRPHNRISAPHNGTPTRTAIRPLPGMIDTDVMVHVNPDRRCDVCDANPAEWTDRAAQCYICQECYERERRDANQRRGLI